LRNFAFVGFLYHILLALGAHIALRESMVLLALFDLVVSVFAFTMDRLYYRQHASTGALSS
jgi:hypothetical protein